MDHHRRVIREAVCTTLRTAGTKAGQRVFDHPYDPRQEFPALVVEDDGEQQEARAMPAGATRPISRRYRFTVTAEVQQSDNAARVRDQLVGEVEAALASAAITGVKAITPLAYQAKNDQSGERPIRVGVQLFEAFYITPQGDPSTTC